MDPKLVDIVQIVSPYRTALYRNNCKTLLYRFRSKVLRNAEKAPEKNVTFKIFN